MAAEVVQQRQAQVEAAQKLFTAGSSAYADKSYGEAMDYFKAAFETIPDVPATEEMRSVFFKRYQRASHTYAEQMVEQAEWEQAEQTLADVVEAARDGGIPVTSIDPAVRETLERLKSKDYYNMAESPRHQRDVDAVKAKLALARGYLHLGDYDRARRAFHQVLNIDRYNEAARRGLEEVERHIMDYADVARDHTRAAKLREVAEKWEMPVPLVRSGETEELPETEVAQGAASIERKLRTLVVPSLEFSGARLVDVLDFLKQKSQELDTGEPNPALRGINIIVDPTGAEGGDDPSQRALNLHLSNVPLGVAIEYAAQQVGMKYRVDQYAVTVIPATASADASMVTQNFEVPPGFLQRSSAGGDENGGAAADPFAEPSGGDSGTLVRRLTAEEFLEQQGVQFGEGAVANFNPATSTLLVRNTPSQMELVKAMVLAAREGGDKMVEVEVKMISVGEEHLRESGMDFLLGPSNLGSSPRVFLGGGTEGNADVPVNAADFPFVAPSGQIIGMHPVTSGLRTGDFQVDTSIDAVIAREQGAQIRSAAPGVFSVAGVFTDPQFQAVVRALNQMKGSDLLCNSRVSVRPGQRAKIEQVREFIYPTEYDPPEIPNSIGIFEIGNTRYISDPPDIFPVTPATPTAFETRSVGKTVEVEPTVGADNHTVGVNVLMDFTDFSGFINYGTPIRNGNFTDANGEAVIVTDNRILMPVFDSIRETTDVTVWDGQTVVIGGFHGESVVDSEDKIPVLGDLPVIGKGFRSETTTSKKRGLLIFVSVRVVDPGQQPINPEVQVRAD